jgi:hypothetical protein
VIEESVTEVKEFHICNLDPDPTPEPEDPLPLPPHPTPGPNNPTPGPAICKNPEILAYSSHQVL